MGKPPSLTREDLAAGFRDAGLEAGDSVIVHSSLRSLGHVAGGADAVLDGLLDAIGPNGNLMLPTFNYTTPPPAPCFDPAETPGRTGIIPETGRKRPEAVRSLHPTHSVAVIGPRADALTRDHLAGRAFGIGSPIDRLVQMGGKVMLIGVGFASNSTVHVAEEHAGIPKAPKVAPLPIFDVLMPDGTIIAHKYDASPSCSAAFGAAEYALRRHGQIRDFRVRNGLIQLMLATDVIKRVGEMIAEQPDALLCTWPGCNPCTGARRNLREQGRM